MDFLVKEWFCSLLRQKKKQLFFEQKICMKSNEILSQTTQQKLRYIIKEVFSFGTLDFYAVEYFDGK